MNFVLLVELKLTMERKSFFKLCLAGVSAMALPFSVLARKIDFGRTDKGFFVGAGKDRNDASINLFDGDTFSTKVSTKDTDGDLYVYESIRVKEGGPAHHVHFTQDEIWYVLQGEFLIKVGETVHHAKAGDTVFGPRMVPHSFAKIGEGEGKLLMTFQPAGKMEEFFTKVSIGVPAKMTEQEQDKFREEHGFKRVGPPIKDFKKM